MSRFLQTLCAYLCIFSLTANAAGPVLWGGNDRAQNLTAQGVTLSSGVTIDNDGLNNFVKASTAETATQPAAWSTYADAAGATPVDCTGGSANITWTRNTTTPLRGAADFKLTKDASNRQGQGVSYAFTTGPSDSTSKLMTISFELKSNEDAAYATSDIGVYIYNVTGAALITPVVTSVVDGAYTFTSQFPLASSSSYRLCFHVATTNASAYDVYFDNVAVAALEDVGFGLVAQSYAGLVQSAGQLLGTNTNDSAATGYVGQYKVSTTTATNFPGATTQWGDATSLSLEAGDWDVTFVVETRINTATGFAGETEMGISSTSGNSATGLTRGLNWFSNLSPTASANITASIPNYRVSIASTTTYYAKLKASYSGGNPQFIGSLIARRVR